jgi:hypothetical protein
MVNHMNFYSIGLTSLLSWGISYFANNTTYGSSTAWRAQRSLRGLLYQFSQDKKYAEQKIEMLKWNNGAINQAAKIFDTVIKKIDERSKWPAFYCGVSMLVGSSIGAFLSKNRKFSRISSSIITASLTLYLTRSTKLALINSLIGQIAFTFFPPLK